MRAPRNDEPAQNSQDEILTKDGSSREPMEHIKHIFDGISFGLAFTTLMGLLPPLAALASILWIGYQFYHSAPMVQMRRNRKYKKK